MDCRSERARDIVGAVVAATKIGKQPSMARGAGAALLGRPFGAARDATGITQAQLLSLHAGSYNSQRQRRIIAHCIEG